MSKRDYFPRVREAREALREKAIDILESYLKICEEARLAGDYETASKSLQWLMEHMPDEDHVRVVDQSIDKPKTGEQRELPRVQIGIALGGIGNQKALPAVKELKAVIVEDDE